LTATATKEVKTDILAKLAMQNPQVFQQSFARANLSYSTLYEENKIARLVAMLQKWQERPSYMSVIVGKRRK
jgi:ATP-dependent DNA helicase RecQ